MNVIIAIMCYNAGMSVTYEDVEREPEKYRVLKNGAIYDLEAGKIAGCPGGGTNAITQANSREYQNKRWSDAAEDIQIGMTRASGKPSIRLAVQEIGVKLWDVIENGQGRDKVAAAKTAMQLGDLSQDRRSQSQDPGQTNVQINMGADAIAQLVGVLDVNNSNELIIDE